MVAAEAARDDIGFKECSYRCRIRTRAGQVVESFMDTLRTLEDADVRMRSGNHRLVLAGNQRCSADHAEPTRRRKGLT